MKLILDNPRIPESHKNGFRLLWDNGLPFDYRDIKMDEREDFIKGYVDPEENQGHWFRAQDILPDNDPALHASAIACGSDGGILLAAARANGVMGRIGIGMIVSLDHSMWFYASARADEWLYYDLHSPLSDNERGIVFERLYNRHLRKESFA